MPVGSTMRTANKWFARTDRRGLRPNNKYQCANARSVFNFFHSNWSAVSRKVRGQICYSKKKKKKEGEMRTSRCAPCSVSEYPYARSAPCTSMMKLSVPASISLCSSTIRAVNPPFAIRKIILRSIRPILRVIPPLPAWIATMALFLSMLSS